MEPIDEKERLKEQITDLSGKIEVDNVMLKQLRNQLATLFCPYKVGQRIVKNSSPKGTYEIILIHASHYFSSDYELLGRKVLKDGKLGATEFKITPWHNEVFKVINVNDKEESHDA